jgi:serine/threonine-protein kinase HipA
MTQFKSVKQVRVGLNFGQDLISVGRLAIRDQQIYFEYDRNFIKQGIEISPFRLPVKSGLSRFDYYLFEGLPGVFNDSLPDGWGRLLMDRFIRSQGILVSEITPLDRLARVGEHGLGALVYLPDYSFIEKPNEINLDTLALKSQEVLLGESSEVLRELVALNGSSAGARPKALIGINDKKNQLIYGAGNLSDDFTPWIVKFPNSLDGVDAGAIEYVYALMAKEAGIEMPEVHLFSAKKSAGYFATKRFDREGKKRFHMHTACGLLHSDFRVPSLDYEDLIALVGNLTRDIREVEKMFRLAVFNVLAHNRDDHSKNFSFLMDQDGQWRLSPAYDLTFSSGPSGEQSTMVKGEGKNPHVEHLFKLGLEANISKIKINEIIEATKSSLSNWKFLSKKFGVTDQNIKLISERLSPKKKAT